MSTPPVKVGEVRVGAGAVVFVAMEGLATVVAHSAEAVGPALERIAQCFEMIVTTHNGEWEGELGSYLISFNAFVDDPAGAAGRAVRATLELARLLDESLEELAARGVVVGPVFAVHVSDTATFTVGRRWRPTPEMQEVGHELLATGSHFSIVASDAVIAAVGHLVKAVPLDVALQRGRGAVFQIGEWHGAAPTRPTWANEGFSVACDEDIQFLLKRWREVKEGEGTYFLTIIGPDGSGKRRLVEELLSQVPDGRGQRHAISSGGESTRLVPLQPLAEVVFRIIDVAPEDDDDEVRRRLRHACRLACRALRVRDVEREATQMAALIGSLFGLGLVSVTSSEIPLLPPRALRKNAFFALTRLLQGLTTDSPRILVFENLHEADGATLEFLDDLGSNSRGQGKMFILSTSRPSLLQEHKSWGRGWWRHETMTFEALDKEELVEVGQAVAGRAGPVPDWLLEEFSAKVGGDPFFMEQLTWLAAARGIRGAVPQARPGEAAPGFESMADDDEIFEEDDEVFDDGAQEDAAEVRWPDDLLATVTQRLDDLPVDQQRILEAGALIGLTFPTAWVEQLLEGEGASDVAAHLRALEAHGFLRRRLHEDAYRFRGEALWLAARSRQGDDAHATLNRRLARLLEQDRRGDRGRAAYARAAVHHQLGGEADRALHCYALGARRARRVDAFDEADACFREAVALLTEDGVVEHSRETLALYLGRGELRLEAGEIEGALSDLEAAAELARALGEARRECDALFLQAVAYDRAGRLDRADDSLAAVAARIQAEGDPRHQILQLRRVGWLRYRTGDAAAARSFLEKAVEISRRSGVDLSAFARSLDDLAVLSWLSDADAKAVDGFTELIATLRGAAGPLASVD